MSDARGGPAPRADFQAEALPHLDAVYRFALRLSGAPDRAEDLTQETFLRAFRSWDQYTPGTRCKSWLFTICRNLFLRERERGQRRDELVQENTLAEGPGGPLANPVWLSVIDSDPEGAFFDSIVDGEVLRSIDALSEDYRTAVVLSDLEGLNYQEIADVLGVPIGTVKSRLFRGRRQLQNALHAYAVEMGYIPRAGAGSGE